MIHATTSPSASQSASTIGASGKVSRENSTGLTGTLQADAIVVPRNQNAGIESLRHSVCPLDGLTSQCKCLYQLIADWILSGCASWRAASQGWS